MEQGEICIRGPQIMKGYLDNIEATKGTIKDGWIHTGQCTKAYVNSKCNLYKE